MIEFKINGKQCSIPSSWDELTFSQYCEFLKPSRDTTALLATLTGLNYESIKNSTIIGLDQVIIALSFLNKPVAIPAYTEKVGPYKLPANKDGQFNIQFETLAQFEDMKAIMKAQGDKPEIEKWTRAYARYVAIYLQKIRDGEYDPDKAKQMVDEVMTYPALEVASAGAFFYIKVVSLLSGTIATSRPTNPNPKKSKRAMKSSRKPSVATGRSRKRR
jgi:hypothetical protein